MGPELLGYAAALATTVAFVPQVLHVLRTRDVASISLGMYAVFVSGIVLWLAYGCTRGDWPMIAANATTLHLAGTVLVLKLRLRKTMTVSERGANARDGGQHLEALEVGRSLLE